jgi:hypothetical protein
MATAPKPAPAAAAEPSWEAQEAAMVAIPKGKEGAPLREIPVPAALAAACSTFEETAGGREALVAHLAHARLSAKEELLVGAIADPRNDQHSLARICQLHGLQFSTLLGLFRDAGFARAQVEAMQKVWGMVPDLAVDVMTRALPHDLPCMECAGTGAKVEHVQEKDSEGKVSLVAHAVQCSGCRGKTTVRHEPEREQQKLALQLAGLISAPGQAGAIVNVNQRVGVGVAVQAGGGAGADVFARFAEASDRVLYPDLGGGDVQEAELVEEPAGAPAAGGAAGADGEEAGGGEAGDPVAPVGAADPDLPDLPDPIDAETAEILAREEAERGPSRGGLPRAWAERR